MIFVETNQDSGIDERSMRILQPKIRILYYIYINKKVKDNISLLSKNLGHSKDGWTNTSINELFKNKMLERFVSNDIQYIRLTRSGRQKISPLIRSRTFIVFIAFLSLIPWIWSIQIIYFNIILTPITLVTSSFLILVISICLIYNEHNFEKHVLEVNKKSHRSS